MSARPSVILGRPLSFDAKGQELATECAFPPPPHDPRERDFAMSLGVWEVRLFGGRKFDYFVSRGFWHLQLWQPETKISVLTPSRLTCGFYEAFPIASWKARATDYDKLVALLDGLCAVALPAPMDVLRIERALVRDVIRAKGIPVS